MPCWACTMTENWLDPIWQVVIPPWKKMYIHMIHMYISIWQEFPSSQQSTISHFWLKKKGGPKRRIFICAKKPMLLGNASCHPYVWSDLNWPCDVPMISTSLRMRWGFGPWTERCCLCVILLMDKIRLTTKDDDYPIIYRVWTNPGGARFLPSTVSMSLCYSTVFMSTSTYIFKV